MSCCCGRQGYEGLYSPQTGHTTLSSTPCRQLENHAPNTTGSNHLYNTLELLMMGIMVPETCSASNEIYNKNSSVASSWHFISTLIILYFNTMYHASFIILYYDQQMHNYFTNYHTPTCFDTIVSSSGSLYLVPC